MTLARRRGWVSVGLVTLMAWGLSACNSSPTAPVGNEVIVENFEGTLTGGSVVVTFVVGQRGTVSVLLRNAFQSATSLQITLGMAVGSWDGTTCELLVKNDASTFNTAISGSALPGNYCATLYDVGNIGGNPVAYAIEVQHF